MTLHLSTTEINGKRGGVTHLSDCWSCDSQLAPQAAGWKFTRRQAWSCCFTDVFMFAIALIPVSQISCGTQIYLLALLRSHIWKMHHLYAWLGARKASYGVDNNSFQWSQLTHYASEILGRGWPTSSQLRFLSVLFMCGCALLKAQLAAKTEESCLETEPVVSIGCPCLRSLPCDFSLELKKNDSVI